jgi:hypothetical protein
MFWIFAAVVLTLAVYHSQFRKALLWSSPVLVLIAVAVLA